MNRLKKFMFTRSTLQGIPKALLQTEQRDKQTQDTIERKQKYNYWTQNWTKNTHTGRTNTYLPPSMPLSRLESSHTVALAGLELTEIYILETGRSGSHIMHPCLDGWNIVWLLNLCRYTSTTYVVLHGYIFLRTLEGNVFLYLHQRRVLCIWNVS